MGYSHSKLIYTQILSSIVLELTLCKFNQGEGIAVGRKIDMPIKIATHCLETYKIVIKMAPHFCLYRWTPSPGQYN